MVTIYIVDCKWCGTTFESLSPRATYCSEKCKREAKSLQQRLYRTADGSATNKCIVCGQEFIKTSAHQLLCSPKCRKQRDREVRRRRKMVDSSNMLACPRKETSLDKSLKELRKSGESYAERQKRQTIEMFARLNTPPK